MSSLPPPPDRKRPGRHTVRAHARGIPSNPRRKIRVDSYRRGFGKVLQGQMGGANKPRSASGREPGSYLSPKNSPNEGTFDIRIVYTSGKVDRITAKVGSFDDAMDVGVRQARSTPASFRIVRN